MIVKGKMVYHVTERGGIHNVTPLEDEKGGRCTVSFPGGAYQVVSSLSLFNSARAAHIAALGRRSAKPTTEQ